MTSHLTDLADQLHALADIALAQVTDVDTYDALAFVQVAQTATTLLERVARSTDIEARTAAEAHLCEIDSAARTATALYRSISEGSAA